MADLASLKLQFRLTPTEGEPNAALLDDLIRLVKQASVTVPKELPAVMTDGEFHKPTEEERKPSSGLESKIKHRIEQASADSRRLVEQRAELMQQPDGEQKAREAALVAAQQVVGAVHRALLRGVAVNVPKET